MQACCRPQTYGGRRNSTADQKLRSDWPSPPPKRLSDLCKAVFVIQRIQPKHEHHREAVDDPSKAEVARTVELIHNHLEASGGRHGQRAPSALIATRSRATLLGYIWIDYSLTQKMPSFADAVGRPHAERCPSLVSDPTATRPKAENYVVSADGLRLMICHSY